MDHYKGLSSDAQLTTSEQAIAAGQVIIDEVSELDLAIVNIETDQLRGGHRFASETSDLIHPFALNNATSCCRLLIIHGHEYMYVDRYETWVQYRSRQLPKRVDLDPLRTQLESLETGTATWTASRPSALTPVLRSTTNSSINAATMKTAIIEYLRSAPSAWNPYRPDS